jgi:modulator of FtsH protease HflC
LIVRKTLIFLVAAVFALALLARATTYTVRFTEAAVLTTFGRAGDNAEQIEPGLKFKWPDPIQSVTRYDTRTRFLSSRLETQQTADSRQLVVEAFATWRVKDPLVFFRRFSSAGPSANDHYRKAEEQLRDALRAALGEISRYRLRDLFTREPGGSKLGEFEAAVLAALHRKSEQGGSLADWGIDVTGVGVSRIIPPEETSKEVVNSMKSEREVIISDLESRGASLESQTIATAEAQVRTIEQFARAYAEDIKRKGNQEAEQFVQAMNANPELAVFLKNLEFIRSVLARRVTFIFNTGMPGFELMEAPRSGESGGRVPGLQSMMGDPAKEALRQQQPAPAGGRP